MGGAHVVYFNTAELLKEYGHEVFFFALKDENALPIEYGEYFPSSTNYRKLSFFSKINAVKKFVYNKEAYNKLNDYIKIIKPDVAHIHLFMGGLTSSILDVLKENNIPIVHTVHDYRLICPAYLFLNGKNEVCEKCKGGKYYNCVINKCSENSISQSAILTIDSYFRSITKKVQSKVDSLVFVSKFSRQKHFDFSFGENRKFDSLYNFMPNLNQIVANSKKGNYFVYYGRISREKGINTLIKAFQNSSINLKIIGTGPLLAEYTNKKYPNIEFVGYKTGAELIELVSNASFIIVPSQWYENNPMTIVEGYSYGKPVIGANIGGIPEIIEDSKTGYLFESGDSEDLLSMVSKADSLSDKEYEKMSKNARQFAEDNFNPEIHYQKLMTIYKKVLAMN